MIGVKNEVESLTRHEIQAVDCTWRDVADFGRDDCEVVIFNLHEKRAHVETRVDQSEAIFCTSFDVKNR